MSLSVVTLKRLNPNGARILAHIFDNLRFDHARPPARLKKNLKQVPRRESTSAAPPKEPVESEPEDEPEESEGPGESEPSNDSDATISDDDDDDMPPQRKARTNRGKGTAKLQLKSQPQSQPKPKPQAPRRAHISAAAPDDVAEKAMCVSYVPVTSCVDPPRSIIDTLPENSTRSINSKKNLYDALCLLKPGAGVCEPSNMNLGAKRKNTVAYNAAAKAYERECPIPPTGDFYIMLRSAPDPPLQYLSADPKQTFVKVTGQFQKPGPNGHFRLPSNMLNLLGKIFVVKGNDTIMTFTDASTGSHGHGYKFNVRGPINGTPSFAFMVEVKARMQPGYVVPGPLLAPDPAPPPAPTFTSAPAPAPAPASAPAPAPASAPAPAPAPAPPSLTDNELEAELAAEFEKDEEPEEPQQPDEDIEEMEIIPEAPLEPSPVNENDFWGIHTMSDIRSSVFKRIELSQKTHDAFEVSFSRYYESRRTDPPVNFAQVVGRIVADMQTALRS